MVEEGGFGVNGAFSQNGGVFSGNGAGASVSKGGIEKGEFMPNNSASEESNGGTTSKLLRAFSFFTNSWNFNICA